MSDLKGRFADDATQVRHDAAHEEVRGLRERKRNATRLAIERAAITLSLERGVDGVTVDEISEAADVSPRTFFNYFPSKEAALIGHGPLLPDAAQTARFLSAGPDEPILDGIRELFYDSMSYKSADDMREVSQLRQKLMVANPHLFALRVAGMEEVEGAVVDLITQRLTTDDPALAVDAEALKRAKLLAYIAFAGTRHAWSCWAELGGKGDLGESMRESFSNLKTVLAVHA
ncbi:TetR family transcriptional regulator [Gryllotalpicola sp.]|uniref:TetR family transcriptional regulator n=1 Tax=Gryllotalpicola sp. TaxID=1932787 RepID=UPI0026132033|nr:TetR family transcriptional regulator [Gryllotalpicola sp.]